MTDAPPYQPDTKDWTWVLEQPCPDCGLEAAAVAPGDLGAALRDNTASWEAVLTGQDPTSRPAPTVWSPTEYACHVRDVHDIFAGRVEQMLSEDGARFADWDQDEAAVADRYDRQQPGEVWPALAAAATRVAATYDAISGDDWQRTGVRSNGSRFTAASLGRYHLHDVVHHLWDVTGDAT